MSWSVTTLVEAWSSVATPADVVAVATAVLAALAIAIAVRIVANAPSGGARERVVPVRVRSDRASAIRSADPDAAGRPRPRAPGH